jgi:hypothetical protein
MDSFNVKSKIKFSFQYCAILVDVFLIKNWNVNDDVVYELKNWVIFVSLFLISQVGGW